MSNSGQKDCDPAIYLYTTVSTLEETKLAVHTKAGTGYCDEFTHWLPQVPEGARARHLAMYYIVPPIDITAIGLYSVYSGVCRFEHIQKKL